MVSMRDSAIVEAPHNRSLKLDAHNLAAAGNNFVNSLRRSLDNSALPGRAGWRLLLLFNSPGNREP
jgi:hypothetical protein